MATATALSEHIGRCLCVLITTLAYLPETFDEWDTMTESDQVSTSLQWDHLMADYLTDMDQHYRAGAMTPEQAERYRHLLADLKAILPRLQAMQFYLPPVSLGG